MARKLQVIGKFNLNSVLYTEQTLTSEQKEQARKNIGIDELPSNTAEQIQADYLQNDSSKLDFIKNRPFYEDEPTITEFMPSTEFTLDADSDQSAYGNVGIATDEQITAWNQDWSKAIVTFGDDIYECEPMYVEGILKAIGNVPIMEGTGDNNLPFIICFMDLENVKQYIVYDLETEYIEGGTSTKTIAIDFKTDNIVKIDKKFLPELTEVTEEQIEFIPDGTTSTTSLNSTYGYMINVSMPEEYAMVWINNTDPVIVTFDGNEYLCKVQDFEGAPAVGDLTSVGGTGNDEPFAMAMTSITADGTTSYYFAIIVFNDTTATEHTFGVSFLSTTEKIKKEFLPDALPEVTTDDNGKFLQVVDGMWTAVSLTNVSEEGA